MNGSETGGLDSNNPEKRFMKIGNDSGCFLANYRLAEENENSVIIVYRGNDKSGVFKLDTKYDARN
jgi:hypothetical protein